MNHRRKFLTGVAALGIAGGAGQFAVGANQDSKQKSDSKPVQETKPKRPPQLDPKLVSQFVGKSHGDFKSVKEMLKKEPMLLNAAWDWQGGDWETGLNAASHVGNRPIAEFLLDKGARLDVCAAVMLGMKGIVKEMLIVNPKLHTVRGAHTIPLLSHAIFGRDQADDVLMMLLDAGADVNITSKVNKTPLMAAASTGRASIVQLLLDQGADPNIKDSEQKTALDVAIKRERAKVVQLLKGVTSQ